MIRVLLANVPWVEGGVRAGSRWPAKYSKDMAVTYSPFPFYMAYTAALLEKNTDCELLVLDCLAEKISHEEFYNRCKKFSPDLIVMETSTVSFDNDIEICKKLKDLTNAKIVLAGPHATVFYKGILLKYQFIDFIAVGEYEFIILDLVKILESGKNTKINGLASRDNNSVILEKRPLLNDLDKLPFPAWHLFQMEKYWSYAAKYPAFQMISSRGCLFKCIFCVYPQTFDCGTYRFNSPERTINEIKFVIENYEPRSIWFDDSTFTMNQERVKKLCDLKTENKIDIEWGCMTHTQVMTEELAKKMRKAGCIRISFGIESGNQTIVNRIGKGLNLEHTKKIFNICKENGIRADATFMFGLPGETKETIKRTMKFVKELNPSFAQFSIATPLPGTKFYEMANKNGWIIKDDFSLYDGNNCSVISYPNLKAEEIEKAAKKAIKWWALHRMSNLNEILRITSIAYRQGGIGRLLSNGKRMLSFGVDYILNR